VKISVKVDYACRVMAELARLHGSGGLAQIEHLAKAEAVPAPEEISLYDILIAVEGKCLHLSGNFDGRSGRRLKQVWDEISEALVKKTKTYTLDQLASKGTAAMYYI
jgi:DNA-binding IscR family transcriptional regulator